MKHNARHRGYVLVVTVGLLVLAATVMTGVGRAAINRTLAARQAQDELQRRWAITSCRATLLPAAEQLLIADEKEHKKPAVSRRASIQLSGITLDLILADEQAKANVNLLLQQPDRAKSQTQLRQALSGSGLVSKVRLRPLSPTSRPASTHPTTAAATTQSTSELISGFGQVFDEISPQQLITGRDAAGNLITCWGGGAINIRRASADALKLACGTLLTGVQIDSIVKTREAMLSGAKKDKKPTTAPAATQEAQASPILAAAGIAPIDRLSLTEASTCHSLWIIARDGRREWYHLMVLDENSPTGPASRWFAW